MTSTALLGTKGLSLHAGTRTLVDALDLSLAAGEILAVLGTNGAGKTTLLETLAGLREAHAGSVTLGDTPLESVSPRARAAHLGLMPQRIDDGFDHVVLERVALGRYARGGAWQWRDDADRQSSLDALARVSLEDCAARRTATLSGGERQRVALAMLLAQDPKTLLLDEPFSQLDPVHQRQTMGLLREQRDAGCGVVLSLHDINAAAHLADRVLLLWGDGRWRLGTTHETLTAGTLSELYATPVRVLKDADGSTFFSVFG